MHSDEMEHQRLGKPTALAVFASDNLSSSAYATEEILHVLIPLVGLAAFSLVVPITVAMLVVLGFLILSYRETIKEYPSAGGAYLVTRDNFGIVPAQVAGASLLTDYILTVAVSAVGRHRRARLRVRRARAVQGADRAVLHRADRLRQPPGREGVREGLRRPHLLLHRQHVRAAGLGLWKYLGGDLPVVGERRGQRPPRRDVRRRRALLRRRALRRAPRLRLRRRRGHRRGGHLQRRARLPGAGVENARQTLVLMGTGLGIMFLGLSMLAAEIKVAPFEDGTPTVIAPGRRGRCTAAARSGDVLFYSLQAGTMLILVMAANTGFADFPRLASFQAGDSFLPRQMTKRGHRLVYSNGILVLAGVADGARGRHRGRGHRADPALRHRRVHGLHALAGRDDQAPPAPARARLAQGRRHQRRRLLLASSWPPSSPSRSSPTAPG